MHAASCGIVYLPYPSLFSWCVPVQLGILVEYVTFEAILEEEWLGCKSQCLLWILSGFGRVCYVLLLDDGFEPDHEWVLKHGVLFLYPWIHFVLRFPKILTRLWCFKVLSLSFPSLFSYSSSSSSSLQKECIQSRSRSLLVILLGVAYRANSDLCLRIIL